MGMDVLIKEPFEREGERRRNKGRRSRERPVIDHIHPYDEVLADFLNLDPIVARSPMLTRWDPIGRSHAHTGSDLEAIIAEVEEARALAEVDSDTALMLGKLSWMARRALAENLVMFVLPD